MQYNMIGTTFMVPHFVFIRFLFFRYVPFAVFNFLRYFDPPGASISSRFVFAYDRLKAKLESVMGVWFKLLPVVKVTQYS